jgi:hypothetical protein
MEDLGREYAINTDIRARSTLAALAQLARSVSGYQGRKNLLWLSASFPLAVGAEMEFNPNVAQDLTHTTSSLLRTREAANLIASAQIAVYPISVMGTQIEGIGAESNGEAEFKKLGHQLGTDREGQFTGRQVAHSEMKDLAQQTGGKAFYGSNDLSNALQLSIQEGSNYYTLAYTPQNANWNGQFRQIRVDVAQKGGSLVYRRSYYALPDVALSSDNRQELNVALQPETPDSTMLRLHAQVKLPREDHAAVLVTSNIDAANVQFTTDAAGHRHAKLLVMLVAFNHGQNQPDSPPQTSGVLNIDLDEQRYQSVAERGIDFQLALTLQPGKYRLRLGVSDMSNHHIGTLDMPLSVNAASAVGH